MIRLAAVSMLVVSSTIVGHFPPSSRVVEVRCSAAARATILPTDTLPVIHFKRVISRSRENLGGGYPVKIPYIMEFNIKIISTYEIITRSMVATISPTDTLPLKA